MVEPCINATGHKLHFIEFTPKNLRQYIDRPGATDVVVTEAKDRYAMFVCEICGEIKKVLIDKTQLD